MSNTEERDAMRDDGLIHARNGNLKSMQHCSESWPFAKYSEVQESQLKQNKELFEPKAGLPKEDIEYIKECLDAAIVTARRNAIINKDKSTGKYYEEDERKLLDVMERFKKHFGGER